MNLSDLSDLSEQEAIVWMAMFTPGVNGRRGLPYCLIGKPGSAKTSIVKALAARAGLPFEGVLGSLRSPVDYLGIPVPQRRKLSAADQHLSPDGDEDFLTMHYAPAGFSVRAALARRAVLLFDEANTAAPAVQAAMLRVLFEGIVGELELPPGVRMLLAMNHTEDAAGGWDIAPPMANRMGWLEWDPPEPAAFQAFLLGGNAPAQPISAAREEASVDEAWPAAWARASGAVAGFLSRRPELLLAMPKRHDASKAWPSPRTWELAARAMAGCEIYKLGPAASERALSAFVGSGPIGELLTWQRLADLPDPLDLLDGKLQFEHRPARPDLTAAVLTSCAAVCTSRKCDPERIGRMWELLKQLSDDCIDLMTNPVGALVRARLMTGYPTAYKVLAGMNPVLAAAGVQS